MVESLAVMSKRLVPAQEFRNEMRVENSRFITTIAPAFSVDEAKDFIAKIKTEFVDASHNVPAFIIGHGASKISHSSDDGEPSGTAGRPALSVLQGSKIGDVVVVITRYFGGTKLGKGGLVRAYGDAVRNILEIAPLAQKTSTQTVKFTIAYSLYELVKRLILSHQGQILDEKFYAEVTITCRLLTKTYLSFNRDLQELTHGNVNVDIIEKNDATIFPIET